MLHYMVIVGTLVYLFGFIAYTKDTLTGKTRPNRVTFALWSIQPLIAAAAAITEGVTWAVIPVVAIGLYPLIIFFASFANKKAHWELGIFDWICCALSLLALLLWWVTNNPNIAIIFAILSDLAAAVPTIKKSWTHPETETPLLYSTATFCAFTSYFAVKSYSFAELAFPTYIVLLCTLITALIYAGRVRLRRCSRGSEI